MAVSGRTGKPAPSRMRLFRSSRATLPEICLTKRPKAENGIITQGYRAYSLSVCSFRSDSTGTVPMKKIILSIAAVALLGGFVAGCAKDETKPVTKVVRKG